MLWSWYVTERADKSSSSQKTSFSIFAHLFLLMMHFFVVEGWGAYKWGKNICARTWRSKREGGLFSGGYGTIHMYHKSKPCHPDGNLKLGCLSVLPPPPPHMCMLLTMLIHIACWWKTLQTCMYGFPLQINMVFTHMFACFLSFPFLLVSQSYQSHNSSQNTQIGWVRQSEYLALFFPLSTLWTAMRLTSLRYKWENELVWHTPC